MHPWLRRLHHDLVKRLLWAARDCRDLGISPDPGALLPSLVDPEGNPVDIATLWKTMRCDAPAHLDVNGFDKALLAAADAAERGDVAGVLMLEPAYQRLVDQDRTHLD